MNWLSRILGSVSARPALRAAPPPADPDVVYRESIYRDGSRRCVLADGREVALPPYSYNADGLATVHDASFLADPRFREAYRAGAHSGHRLCAPDELHIEWRVYVCCWAARHAAQLPGAFVECGVSTGIVSLAVCRYVAFETLTKTFWLLDTFGGIPEDQASEGERALASSKNRRHYFDSFDLVKDNFSAYPNVRLVRGTLPESLDGVALDEIAYLHIDMNIAYPEVETSRRLWDRMTRGGVVIYDDYASPAHAAQ
ncbi:MAG: TylF/MycF/NovP-related O-methyltransferase, partial [Burkholderiales bacterium]|nr:TylF/MycF/NovP-related O-methyltransferase [Burkholderiales bacterium]